MVSSRCHYHPYYNRYEERHDSSEVSDAAKIAYAILLMTIRDILDDPTVIDHVRHSKNLRLIRRSNKLAGLLWVANNDRDYVFSFINCCNHLNISYKIVRNKILNNGLNRAGFYTSSNGTRSQASSHQRRERYAQSGATSAKSRRRKARIKNHQ